jgi:hypothetical protein
VFRFDSREPSPRAHVSCCVADIASRAIHAIHACVRFTPRIRNYAMGIHYTFSLLTFALHIRTIGAQIFWTPSQNSNFE